MKLHHLLIVATTLLALPACEKQTTTEKIKDKVDDALDRRPGEKVLDAAEDVKDAAKDVGRDIKDAAKDAKDGAKDVVKDVKEAVKEDNK
jgi:gas vesicle protein